MGRRKGLVLAGGAAIVALCVLASCAGGDDTTDVATPTDSQATTTSATSETTAPGSSDGVGTTTTAPAEAGTSTVAQARGDAIGVWRTPNGDDPPAHTLRKADEPNHQVVMLVKQQFGGNWLEVYLPAAPPGSTGWVRVRDVRLSRHRFRIEVSRSAHTLTVYAGDVSALETPVAIGPDAPQPTQGLYIKSLLEPANQTGPYGRYAYGLSGSPTSVDAFATGSGLVGIHGTNAPGTLGHDASRGSMAIGADDLNRLVSSIGLPLGTPVEIVR
jgi:lipoprotein-anchoring transpeptidase ErfK/SrfK